MKLKHAKELLQRAINGYRLSYNSTAQRKRLTETLQKEYKIKFAELQEEIDYIDSLND